MTGYYEVYLRNQTVGKVQLIRQGLYYRVICRCRFPDQQIYRLFAVSGSNQENLGVVLPEQDGYFLDRKIPAKRLGEDIRFVLSTGADHLSGAFVPICPEEPFRYIDRLKTSFLQSEHGKIGIRVEEKPEAV